MQTHGVSLTSVYASVWGVVNAINSTSELGYPFPSHERQREIAKGFHSLSRAGFDKVIGALDGIVICTLRPSLSECKAVKCGQTNFRCHRKDKYGLNLQAICDDKLRFIWSDMKWPAATSDYMAEIEIRDFIHIQVEAAFRRRLFVNEKKTSRKSTTCSSINIHNNIMLNKK